jgi:hypothetical protein
MPRKAISEFTTIGIRKPTRDRLKEHGKKVEFYDDIIQRILDFYDDHIDEYPEKRSPTKRR